MPFWRISGVQTGFIAAVFTVAMGSWAAIVGGQESPATRFSTMDGDKSLSITSHKMLIKNQENKILFEGDVVMERDGLTLKAGEVEILFSSKDSGGTNAIEGTSDKRQITTITAVRDVQLTQGVRSITSQHVVYYRQEEKMVFTGEPLVNEGSDEVRGERITVFLKDDRALVEGGVAIIHPK